MWLLDANILVRLCEPRHQQHKKLVKAIKFIDKAKDPCVLVPQALYEFWVVATRPVENNGLGHTPAVTKEKMDEFLHLFYLAKNELAIFDHWLRLVEEHKVRGARAHDARLVAAMERHGINQLLTYNLRDFKRYQGILVMSPTQVLTQFR